MSELITRYRWVLLAILALIIGIGIFLFLRSQSGDISQQPFTITSTEPRDGTTNLYTGEMAISFKTNVLLLSPNAFTMTISPRLPHYWQFKNTYPTNEVIAEVYGGFATNTTYTITVKDNTGGKTTSWSFTTEGNPPQSSTGLEVEKNQQLVENYYPLANVVPFQNNDFSIDYVSRSTLEVVIKNPDVDKVKHEVKTWITNQGVDPNTQQILYKEDF
jgi:hypothetical protein